MMFIKTGFCCHANRLLLHKRLEFHGKETQKIRVTINYDFIYRKKVVESKGFRML